MIKNREQFKQEFNTIFIQELLTTSFEPDGNILWVLEFLQETYKQPNGINKKPKT